MNKKIISLVIASFAPALCQFFATYFGSYWIGLVLRLFVHIILPIVVVQYIRKLSFGESFLVPLHFKSSKFFKQIVFFGCFLGGGLIVATTVILLRYINFDAIADNLTSNYGITAYTYPFVALAIVVVNSTMEEYFWRGFIFRGIYENATTQIGKKLSYLTGILFAVHHTIIFQGWFNWWQWTLVTVFLAIVGIVFNHIYKKTGSIYATWAIHAFADLVLVVIGFILIF